MFFDQILKSMNPIFFKLFIFISLVSVSACRQMDVFEKNTVIPGHSWDRSFGASGNFTISDTVSAYNIYIVLRHTDAYLYNNIWLNIGLQSPGDSMFFQKIDLSLGSDATGWEGTGMNDIWEVRKILNSQPRRFIKAGDYKFVIHQVMRDNPLRGIMSAGLRVEKAR